MAIEMMGGVAKGSISDVKRSPMEIFNLSEKLNQAVYILNRNDVAGVILDKELYEDMTRTIEDMQEKIFELETFYRVNKADSEKKSKTYTLEEVTGHDLSDIEFDENDGWE